MTGVNKAELRRLCEDAPHGEFELQTGCSWRRIGMKGDGDILRPVIHQHDGWPDLCAADGMLEFIAGCTPAKVQALLDECDRKDSLLEEYKRGGRCALELLEDTESERDAALAELEACRKDAERYRFLKGQGHFRAMSIDMGGNHSWTGMGRNVGKGPTVDDAIDAAMAQEATNA